ncbi:tetratricopeptide repeat protein [Spirochaeta isovalerica]|uniref:Tetratricopeptide (TPR) repeat protein n=1 Tax=Spirochaeta isovalerica TaxID=150 RepID=A0A841R9F2_9SPIO|nr:tetratricopeptide repeat protein [Spirochaeta isovalerica]MBB6479092.1 tetratricopeptide (TPR) repeat protein [Spirochaeta isovalerica]
MKKTVRTKTRSSRKGIHLVIPSTAIILLALLAALIYGADRLNRNLTSNINSVDVSLLWEEKEYDRIIELTENKLDEEPLHAVSLIYCGFSYFYKGVSQVSVERSLPMIDRSIFLLKKALMLDSVPMESRIHYVLGKAYLHKNYYYADQAAMHLEKSIQDGFINDDSYEYLGQAYSLLKDYDKSIDFYMKALERNKTDRLYLRLADDFYNRGDYDDSEKYLKLMIENTRDEPLKKKGLFQLANLYYDMKNYREAEIVLKELIALESGNENYHFLLGEVYFFMDDIPNARSQWHKTTRINPKHIGALTRLYG